MQVDGRLSALKEISQVNLANILNKIPGKKDLIIDGVIMKALDRVTGVSVLRKQNVDKIFKLDCSAPHMSCNDARVYMVMSDLIPVKRVCDQINAEGGKDISYHLILVPRRSAAVNQLIEEEGLWDKVKIYAFQWEPIQLDIGLVSLELPSLFRNLFVDGDQTLLPAVARTLWSLQMVLGKAQVTVTLGKYAKHVQSMTEILMHQLGESDRAHTDIGCIMVVDRDVDYAAALLTPATYTSLVDEVLGIRSGVVEIPKSDASAEDKSPIGYLLSSEDEIYSQIKNRHFSDVFSFLSLRAKQLSSDHERSQKMALHEIKQYVSSQLKTAMDNKRALAMHIACCEAVITSIGSRFESLQDIERNMLEGVSRRGVISYIEENLAGGVGGKLATLRLMCLLSLTQDGLFADDIWSLKTQFLHEYGYQLLPGISNLETLGLLTATSSGPGGSTVVDATGRLANKVAQVVSLPKRSSFQVMRQKLKLYSPNGDDMNLKQPTDLSYVFGGVYIPIACQLIHMLVKKELSFEDIAIQVLPGASVTPPKASIDFIPRSFLVFFIGGVTYAEVAAFKLLEQLTGTRIVVAGTSMVNGSTLVGSAL